MYKLYLISLIYLLHYKICEAKPRIDPLVETNLGLIRGIQSDDGKYSKFFGIPYAIVDETQPFGPSIPNDGFNQTFNAFDDSVMCPQMRDGSPVGHIQCLNLNIYAPSSANRNNLLPVMIYIHGGAFYEGGGPLDETPEYLIEKDIVFVSLNYRLGMYGFFCTDSPKAPGNIGLKDQLIGLRWVKANIEAFGGDASKITVFGESAGSMSIHLHLLSPHEQLFEGAIMESGPATSPYTINRVDNSLPIKVAAYLGYSTENVDEALDFISRPEVELVTVAGDNALIDPDYDLEMLTKPCVEIEQEGVERFITVNPNHAVPEKLKNVPVIIGISSQELIFQHGTRNADFFNNYSFESVLRLDFNANVVGDIVDTVKHFYIGDSDPNVDLVNEMTSFASDFIFNYPTEKAVQDMLNVEPRAVYQYLFNYEGAEYFKPLVDIEGVSHASELLYVLKEDFVNRTEHEEIIERIITLWTNFAKYGDPTPEITDLLPVKWEPVTNDNRFYLDINKDLSIGRRIFHDRMTFWELFYKVNAPWYDEDN